MSSSPEDDDPVALVVYLVSRFPKVTETFILNEIVELRRRGVPVVVRALARTTEDVVQPEVVGLLTDAGFGERSPLRLLAAQLAWLRRRPRTLVRLWRRVVVGHARSPRELAKAVLTTAAAVHWALDLRDLPVLRLHAHWATHPTLAARVIGELTGLPYGFTSHAHDIYGPNPALRDKLAHADLAVTISDFNRDLLLRRFGAAADHVRVVRCGVDRAAFRPTPARPSPLTPLRLLCVASLTEYKGHRHLLDALTVLRAEGVPVECVLVGDGPLRADLEAQVERLGLGGQVVFAGRRPAPEVRRRLVECDVFVLPSVLAPGGMMEGIPVALMEALASGRPAVASRLSGIPELVVDRQTGLTVPPGDAPALAAALLELHRDEALRARLSEAGPRRVAEDFDLHDNVAQLHGLLVGGDGLRL